MSNGTVSTETKLRDDIVLLARSLFERGLTSGSTGNLSARTDDGGFLMTPTNSSFGFLDAAKLSKLDASGHHQSGDAATKEAFLHLAMYRGAPQAAAVSHLHSTYCVCLSCLSNIIPDDMIPPLTPYLAMRVGPIALAPYHRPGDAALGPHIERLAAKHNGLIIENHGPVVAGKSLHDAVFGIEELEESAKLAFLLKDHDTRSLSQQQLNELDALSLKPTR